VIFSNNRAAQRFNASGQATEQAELPAEFIATPQPSSPLNANLEPPVDHLSFFPGQPNFVVRRWPRMVGMRYLYASGYVEQPVKHIGANCIPRPEPSAFQPNLHGPIHNAGFNDRIHADSNTMPNGIGWPGRANLGLSFKVPASEKNTASTTSAYTRASQRLQGPRSARPASTRIVPVRRSNVARTPESEQGE